MAVSFDPFDPEFQTDPYPALEQLRSEDPVHHSPLGFWVLSRYEDVKAALKDERFRTEWGALTRSGIEGGPLNKLDNSWLFTIDPPDHTRIRKLVAKAFTPRRVNQMRGAVRDLASRLLSRFNSGDEIDVVGDFAFPIPITVICELLGIPGGDHTRMRQLTEDFIVAFEPVPPPGGMEKTEQASGEFIEYAGELIDKRRQSPSDDLLSALIQAEEQDDRLSQIELISNVALIVGAGFETTTNLIGSCTRLLLNNPEQLALVKSNPDLLANAIWETLRMESPAQFTGRITTEPVEINGRRIPEGENVIMLFGGANRDPEVFDDPETFSVTRESESPLAFGAGIHFCIGAALARVEGEEAIATLLHRDPELVEQAPVWREGFAFRGLKRLTVLLRN